MSRSDSVSVSDFVPSMFLSSGATVPAVLGAGWLSPLSRRLPLLVCGLLLPAAAARAAELFPSPGAENAYFGDSAGISGNIAVFGAPFEVSGASLTVGAAYLFRGLDSISGTATQTARLTASDRAADDAFGESSCLSGNMALVGAAGDDSSRGSAYLFRNLDTASGTVTQNIKLTAADGAAKDAFGVSCSLSGSIGVVGAFRDNTSRGAAYVFRNLNTRSGAYTQHAKLTASDGAANDELGWACSISGTTALVGAAGKNALRGAAYLFRNLNSALGLVTQTAKLTASDGMEGDGFGAATGFSGNTGLVTATAHNSLQGAAYLFRGLDTVSGSVTQNAKLIASDARNGDLFGFSASLSGDTALIGALAMKGAAYLYRGVDTATGTVTENVKLTASVSDGRLGDHFGMSVALDGDRFVIAERTGEGMETSTGSAHSGRVSAFTTVDEGEANRSTGGLSFVSREDWVIGQSAVGNRNTLTTGDSGAVSAVGKAVYVGRGAGADHNSFTVDGVLNTNFVRVGAAGNTGNGLRIAGTLYTKVGGSGGVTVAAGSRVGGKGSMAGDLRLEAGAFWDFSPGETLNVHGTVFLDRGFGVASLSGLSPGTPAGSYRLIEDTLTDFGALRLTNWGEANAFNLGGGKRAWFVEVRRQATRDLLLIVEAGGPAGGDLPALNVSRAGDQVTLTWTTPVEGLVLDSSTELTSGWRAVEAVYVRNGNVYTLTQPVSGGRSFYRLRRP